MSRKLKFKVQLTAFDFQIVKILSLSLLPQLSIAFWRQILHNCPITANPPLFKRYLILAVCEAWKPMATSIVQGFVPICKVGVLTPPTQLDLPAGTLCQGASCLKGDTGCTAKVMFYRLYSGTNWCKPEIVLVLLLGSKSFGTLPQDKKGLYLDQTPKMARMQILFFLGLLQFCSAFSPAAFSETPHKSYLLPLLSFCLDMCRGNLCFMEVWKVTLIHVFCVTGWNLCYWKGAGTCHTISFQGFGTLCGLYSLWTLLFVARRQFFKPLLLHTKILSPQKLLDSLR